MIDADRAVRALEDVVAVERIAPGLVRVVTWSDAYPVDARDAGCNCPDKTYREVPMCKHEYAAHVATSDDIPAPYNVTDNLDARTVATDGGEDERPNSCECDGLVRSETPCFPCFMAGFDAPAGGEA